MKDEEVSGEGYVEDTPEGIVIEVIDYNVKKYFSKAMVDGIFIGGMNFSGENLNKGYCGRFMIKRIDNNIITLKKLNFNI